jgi:hypothetical protein
MKKNFLLTDTKESEFFATATFFSRRRVAIAENP